MSRVYLSLGSNIEPEKNIPAAIDLLIAKLKVTGVSSVYETDPVGPAGNKKFWDLAAAVETSLPLNELIQVLREIEADLGRKREADKFAPRTLDIDVLPQPGYQKLAFIVVPLAEIAPQEKDPETGKSFKDLAEGLKEETKNWRKV